MARVIYFISHPDVEINPAVPVTEWGLSEKGRHRFEQLLHKSWVQSVSAIYCSDEQKAIDGARMFSVFTGLEYQTVADLGENDRTATGYLPGPEFEATADQFFSKPEASVRGWETAAAAQRRIVEAVTQIDISLNHTSSIAIISHGAVGTLLYCYLNHKKIDRRWDQPGAGGGNYMVIHTGPAQTCSWWQPID